MSSNPSKRPVGRPPSSAPSAHDAILTAVQDLLQEVSVRDLTIDAVASRAGVGKTTIYKWWDGKTDLVFEMFKERVIPSFATPDASTLEQSIRIRAQALIRVFNTFFGKVMADLVAESQSEPKLLQALNEQYIRPRREATMVDIRLAQKEGRFPANVDPEVVVDAIFGGIYYTMLLKLRPLTPEYADDLVDFVMNPYRENKLADNDSFKQWRDSRDLTS